MEEGQRAGHASSAQRGQIRATIIKDLINVTWRMLVPTMIGLFAGMYIDGLINTSPAGFLLGSLLGFVAGIWLALKVLQSAREATR